MVQVKKRNGDIVDYDIGKIRIAIEKAFIGADVDPVTDTIDRIVDRVDDRIRRLDSIVSIETIQDVVEDTISEMGYVSVAKAYILYRQQHAEYREKLSVKLDDGSILDHKALLKDLMEFIDGVEDTSLRDLVYEIGSHLYDGVEPKTIEDIVLLSIRSFMTLKPQYDKVASRAHIRYVKRDIYRNLGLDDNPPIDVYMDRYLASAVADGLLDPKVVDVYRDHIDYLSSIYRDERDDLLTYLSAKTLSDRYLIRDRYKKIIETPQMLFMRVSMGLFYREDDPVKWVADFYDKISTLSYMPSTPTLFNAATCRQQLSSCYLTTVEDSLDGIFDALKEDARLSKYAGGIANDWTPVRALGAHIRGTNGESQGIVPFLKLVNDTAIAVNQCFYPGTYVNTHRGHIPIEQITTDDYVVDFDGNYGKVVAVHKYPTKPTDRFYRIETSDTKIPIIVSESHPICSLTDRYIWVKASELRPGMVVVRRREKPSVGTDITADDIDLLTVGRIYFTYLAQQYGFPVLSDTTIDTDIDIDKHIESYRQSGSGILSIRHLARPIVESFRYVASQYADNDMVYRYVTTLDDFLDIRKIEEIAGVEGRYLSRIVETFMDKDTYVVEMPLDDKFDPSIDHYLEYVTNIEEIRPRFSYVYDLEVETVPSYNIANVTVHNGGKRRGSICCYLEIWHADILDFIDLKKNTGDERRRTHDMNTACWIPDYFMDVLEENGTWYLFSPDEVPDLHELTGIAFRQRYQEYVDMGKSGRLRIFKEIPAFDLWRRLITSLYETGHPWITFKDIANHRYPNQHIGIVKSSNLCTEILLHTSNKETAVCNLGSIVLTRHLSDNPSIEYDSSGSPILSSYIDIDKLRETIHIAIRGLDNVIDINFYPSEKAEYSNRRNRPIGLGLMGFQDVLQILEIPYEDPVAAEIADQIQEQIAYEAIRASIDLAKEKGPYPTYSGSLWDLGKLPIDTIDIAEQERGRPIDIDRTTRLDWTPIREDLNRYGIRNGLLMAIAPTATIGNICGVSPSIEPTYQNLYVKSNLSGEFVIYNRILVDKLKSLGLWTDALVRQLIQNDGSIQDIDDIPDHLKRVFKTAFEIDQKALIDCAAKRQKWIDQSQSLNLYVKHPTGRYLSELYTYAYLKGIKTTYYLRAIAATAVDKAVDSDTDSEIKVCSLDSECEVCQ